MKVYLTYAPSYHDLLIEEACRRVMISFGTQGRFSKPTLPDGFDEYLLDSGGHQASRGTEKRPLYEPSYCNWVKALLDHYGDKIVGYMAADYGGDDITFENTLWMQYRDLNPIPIWKENWGESSLDHYCQNYKYVAIVGVAGSGSKGKRRYQELAEKSIAKYPQTMFHFLGVGINASAFNSHLPYSIDSSTWLVPVIYGNDVILDKNGGLKEVPLLPHLKQRIREDPEFAENIVRKAIRNILSLERSGNDYNS